MRGWVLDAPISARPLAEGCACFHSKLCQRPVTLRPRSHKWLRLAAMAPSAACACRRRYAGGFGGVAGIGLQDDFIERQARIDYLFQDPRRRASSSDRDCVSGTEKPASAAAALRQTEWVDNSKLDAKWARFNAGHE